MIYGIGDLHFDHSKQKPMDIFGDNWINHDQNIIENWINTVTEEDLVLIPGDISWALRLEDAKEDLEIIHRLPGRKIMIKGNHDYWWNSLSKLNNLGLDSIFFIQNNSFIYNDIGIIGTRGWLPRDSESFTKDDERIFNRELNRLRFSLESLDNTVVKKIAMFHYPPFNIDFSTNEFVEILKEYNVDMCIYGHLHAEGHKYIIEGLIEGVDFHCVSSDFIDFNLKKIKEE